MREVLSNVVPAYSIHALPGQPGVILSFFEIDAERYSIVASFPLASCPRGNLA